jgi:hypothetical protein
MVLYVSNFKTLYSIIHAKFFIPTGLVDMELERIHGK